MVNKIKKDYMDIVFRRRVITMNNLISAGIRYLSDKKYRFDMNTSLGLHNKMDDEIFLKRRFRLAMGYDLNLIEPRTYSEKIQWLKLYDRRPEYTIMVDKVLAKEHVKKIIGSQYIIPTLGVWENPDDIVFSDLPERFVLKCNHNSG